MQKVLQLLQGKKSYIASVLIALYTLLQAFGVITTSPEQDQTVYGLLGALLGVSLRDAIARK
jgi:hypothetical protein